MGRCTVNIRGYCSLSRPLYEVILWVRSNSVVVMCREKVKKYLLYSGFYLHHIVFHALSPLSPLTFACGLPLFSMLRVHVWRKKKGWGVTGQTDSLGLEGMRFLRRRWASSGAFRCPSVEPKSKTDFLRLLLKLFRYIKIDGTKQN